MESQFGAPTSMSPPVLNKTSTEDDIERSLRKTKTLIADYVLCNDFELFATFTFSPKKTSDRFKPEVVKLQMANWLKNQQARYGKFSYLIVSEFHADRKALHFHALIKGYKGILEETGKSSKGRLIYYFKSYTLGFNSAVKIDNPEKVSSYIRKYITKDMPQFRGKHRFWATHDLTKPRAQDNINLAALGTPDKTHENEYGVTLLFLNRSSLATESQSHAEDSSKPRKRSH